MTEGQPSNPSFKVRISRFLEKIGLTHLRPKRVRVFDSASASIPEISAEKNANASRYFLRSIRDANKIVRQERGISGNTELIDDRGLRVNAPLETGFFHTTDVLNVAENRYSLPMAVYVTGNHARLVLRGPHIGSSGQREIQVYDPMKNGVRTEILDQAPEMDFTVIPANTLAGADVFSGNYDILSLLEDPRIAKYRAALFDAKLAILQFAGDYSNCVPLCLLTNAMFYGLQRGNTPFKTTGIPQFEKDFSVQHVGMQMGVRILKREEILPPEPPTPRVRVTRVRVS